MKTTRQSGLGLIALLLFIAAILIIGGIIVYVLVKICKRVFPPPPPPNGIVQVVESGEFPTSDEVAQGGSPIPVINLPNFQFDPVPELRQGATISDVQMEIQRSTNLLHWEPLFRTNLNYQFQMCDDTNEGDMAFYRMMLILP